MTTTEKLTNEERLALRMERFNSRTGPRVGDYLRCAIDDPRQPEYTRFTHDWGDSLQTGGVAGGSYYFSNNGYLSYSGGLDPGLKKSDLIAIEETKEGYIWFFDQDMSGPGRGVNFKADMRVFRPTPTANLDGVYSLQCPYMLTILDAEGHAKTCDYWYLIHNGALSCTAFNKEAQLMEWLRANKIHTTKPLTTPGVRSFQRLAYGDITKLTLSPPLSAAEPA